MSTQELLIQIKALPLKDQMELMEALQRSLQKQAKPARRRIPVERNQGNCQTGWPAANPFRSGVTHY
jgi:hypothetical protein